MTRAPDPGSGTRTVRPGNWRLSIVVPLAVVSGVCIAIGVVQLTADQPAQASFAAALWTPALFYCVINLLTLRIRMEITESVVRARQGRWRGHPDLEVPRHDVLAIHYFPRIISFRGPDDKPFMRIDCNYTLRQVRAVAQLLRVPLYDHKRWLGLREARIGRLVYDPAASDRVS